MSIFPIRVQGEATYVFEEYLLSEYLLVNQVLAITYVIAPV